MQSLGGEKLAGSGFALDGDEAEMGGGAAHAGKELLHGEAAAGHFTEHPLLGLQGLRFQRFEVDRFIDGEGPRAESHGVGSGGVDAIRNHGVVQPAAGDIGKNVGGMKAREPRAQPRREFDRVGAIPGEGGCIQDFGRGL